MMCVRLSGRVSGLIRDRELELERGLSNYTLVRQEWAAAASAAAGGDGSHLDAALSLLRSIEAGLTSTRPATPGRPAALM